MVSYISLERYRYTLNKKINLDVDSEIEKEYKNRIFGPSTVKTSMRPVLIDKYNVQHSDYVIFLVLTNDIHELTSKIYRTSKKIEMLARRLPTVAKQSFIHNLIINELEYTNDIEGVKTNRQEISTMIENVTKDRKRKARLSSTGKLYSDSIKGKPIKIYKLEDFRNIYNTLLDGEIENKFLPDGKLFRDGAENIWIGYEDKKIHIPPKSEAQISNALLTLIDFMNIDNLDPIIKAIVTHFMFENTHPFNDGNGRTGRYLLSSYLSSKIDMYTGISISTAIHSAVQKYYKLFEEAGKLENRADLTLFLKGMLKIIYDGQKDVISDLEEKASLLEVGKEYIQDKYANFNDMKREILYTLFQSEIFTDGVTPPIEDREIFEHLRGEYPKTHLKKAIDELTENGIIMQTGGKPLKHKINFEV
ncbi:Fic family protein [Weissella coleopterorum]|uniref:Fic family protein n=1 Tax=Weissella coleopterorum TaxID=2714949 RepID=A0A6G8AY15_9LACO|nr:Fic family protein [Weissella coleopterorum]QIL49870.1 Fic family protein [Weissella coleopterorum]